MKPSRTAGSTLEPPSRLARSLASGAHPFASLGFFALSCALVAGCDSGDGLDRQPVRGIVTVDGEPLSAGAILFEPATADSGTAVGATIKRGEFAIARHQGPVPGRYRVRIYASAANQAPPAKGQTDRTTRPMAERLPARYNTDTELSAVVSSRAGSPYRFELSSQGQDRPSSSR